MFSKNIFCLLCVSLLLSVAFPCFSASKVARAIVAESYEVTGYLKLGSQRYLHVECTEKLILGAEGHFGVTLTFSDHQNAVLEKAFIDLSDLEDFTASVKSLLSLERNSVGAFKYFTASVTSKNTQLTIVKRSNLESVYFTQFTSSGLEVELQEEQVKLVVEYLEKSLKKINALT